MPLITALKKAFSLSDLRDDPEKLRREVRESYSRAATNPEARHPFPCGKDFALRLGYPQFLLATLPARTTASFVGVANVSVFAWLPVGASVLDIGCGAGLDALVSARRVGPTGQVIGLDFSYEMLKVARDSAIEKCFANLKFICGEAERLPLPDRSVDVVLVNGIFNLNADRAAVFKEIGRVTRPGGMVYAAELVLTGPLPKKRIRHAEDWFS